MAAGRYNKEPSQEEQIKQSTVVTDPAELTALLGHSWRENRDITPELIFSYVPLSIPRTLVQQLANIEELYREQAKHCIGNSEHYRIAAAFMGGVEEWQVLREDKSAAVRMAVAQAADDYSQTALILDPEPAVRQQVARYSTDAVRQVLLREELKYEHPSADIISEIGLHARDPKLLSLAAEQLWDKPELLLKFTESLQAPTADFLSLLIEHENEDVRTQAAFLAIDIDHPGIARKVLQGELSDFTRERLEQELQEYQFRQLDGFAAAQDENTEPPLSNGEQEEPNLEEIDDLSVISAEDLANGKTFVTILSDVDGALQRGTVLTLEDANKLFAELDRRAAETGEFAGTRVEFRLRSQIGDELFTYHGQYDLGDGDGSLTDHIRKYNEFCATAPEWGEYITGQLGQEEWQAQLAEHQYVLNTVLPELAQREISASIDETVLPKEPPLSNGEPEKAPGNALPIEEFEKAITRTTIVSQQRIYRVVDLTEEQMQQNGYRILNDSADGLYRIMGNDKEIYAVAKPIEDLRDFSERVYQFVEEFDSGIFPASLTREECINNLMDHCKAGLSEDVTRPLLAAINLSDSNEIKQKAAGLILAYRKQESRWIDPEMAQKVKERAAAKDKVASQKKQKPKKQTKKRNWDAEL